MITIIVQLLPLLLAPLLYALLTKAAAFIFRRTQLSWLHAFLFGVLVLIVGATGAFLNQMSGMLFPLPISVLLGFTVFMLLGGWYLGPRAKTAEGIALEFKGGLLLSLVVYGLFLVFGLGAAVLLPFLQHAS